MQTVKIARTHNGQPVLQFDRRLHPGEDSTRLRWWQFDPVPRTSGFVRNLVDGKRVEIPLAESAPALGALLPVINAQGGSQRVVSGAVSLLETRGTYGLLHDVTSAVPTLRWYASETGRISKLPAEFRLALEMATHEDQERIALEGELAALEERWKEAEEIAAIADDMFLPSSVTEWVAHAHGRA